MSKSAPTENEVTCYECEDTIPEDEAAEWSIFLLCPECYEAVSNG